MLSAWYKDAIPTGKNETDGAIHAAPPSHWISAMQERKKQIGFSSETDFQLFARHQPKFAAHGVATFPCSTSEKKPLVTNYFQMGVRASTALTRRFANADAMGFATGRRNGITVLDVDVPDQRVLDDAVARHGEPRIVVRTASGKFHAYYRHNGEPRKVRPWPERPIDLLGERSVVMAPPSRFGSGRYDIIHGTLDDLDRLTTMHGLDDLAPSPETEQQGAAADDPPIRQGQRNNWLWRECMRQARQCENLGALLDFARTRNQNCTPPLGETEIMTIAASAWTKTTEGRNRFGQHGAWIPVEVAASMMVHPDALALLVVLRANEGPWIQFMIPNTMAGKFGWTVKRLQKARLMLITPATSD